MSTVLDDAQRDGVVIGLGKATGAVADRVDIDVLLTKEPKTFNLFLIALSDLQSPQFNTKDAKSKMGYFQVAGIHGFPLVEWDGVAGNNNTVPVDRQGNRKPRTGSYCTHGSILFPTWHRPYLAMLEQTIYARMVEIAKKFKSPTNPNLANEYLDAAKTFRLPTWDYFRPRGGKVTFPGRRTTDGQTSFDFNFDLPQILKTKQVSVLQPPLGDTLTKLDNPLLAYNFLTDSLLKEQDFATLDKGVDDSRISRGQAAGQHYSRKQTTRQPDFASDQESSNYDTLSQTLNRGRANAVKRLLLILENISDYPTFATSSKPGDSLESLHDTYHGNIGGSGHMGMVPVAAFDPIFWLHHANIDRYAAIWQYINDDAWFSQAGNTLWPFRTRAGNDKANFWDSNLARQTENLGYNYPDLSGKPTVDDLKQDFGRRYRWSESDRNGIPLVCPQDMLPIPVQGAQVFLPPGPLSKPSGNATNGNPTKSPQTSARVASHAPAFASATMERIQPVEQTPLRAETSARPSDSDLLANHPPGTHLVREWKVNSEVARNALNNSFTIMFFLGDVNDEANNWRNEPNLAATNHVFVSPTDVCDNCHGQAERHEIYHDSDFLTPMLQDLVDEGELPDLSVETIVPYLTQNLHWRVLDITRQSVLLDRVEGLQIQVSSQVKFFQPGSFVPEYGEETVHPECTAGRIQ